MKSGWTDRFWTAPDGVRLYGRDYPGAAGEARLPVVCLHGLTRNSRDFEDVAPAIAGGGRRVLALDVRGRGRSGRDPDPTRYQPGVYAQDVAGFLDALGIGRAVFVGTSMGGLIGMVLAALRPELIAAFVINDVGPRLSPVGLARITGYTGKPVRIRNWREAREYAERINGAAFPAYRKADWKRFAARLFDEDAQGRPVQAYDLAITEGYKDTPPDRPAPDMDALFQGLAGGRPVLLVRGGLSDLLDPDGVALMRELAPHLEVAEVPGVGHAPMLTEPEAARALAGFLARVP